MSLGVTTQQEEGLTPDVAPQVRTTCRAVTEAGLASGQVGLEMNSSVLPINIAQGLSAAGRVNL